MVEGVNKRKNTKLHLQQKKAFKSNCNSPPPPSPPNGHYSLNISVLILGNTYSNSKAQHYAYLEVMKL